MTLLLAGLTALGVAAASGLPGDDELVGGGARRVSVDASKNAVFGLDWRRPVVRTGVFRTVATSFGAPVVSETHRLIVIGSGGGDVLALSLADGTLRWRYRHGAPFIGTAVLAKLAGDDVEAELVVLGSLDSSLLAIDVGTGALLWRAELDGAVRAPARVLGTRLLVTTSNNKLVLLDGLTGNRLWSKGRAAPSGLTVDGNAAALAVGGRVYATYADGYAEAYRLEDGSLVWSRPLSISGAKFIDADADPVLADGRLYVAAYADGVFALNPEDGQTLWSRNAPAVVSLGTYEDILVAASADGWVWGFATEDGRLAYRTRFKAGAVSRLAIHDRLMVLSAGDYGLVVLDAATGKPLQSLSLGSAFAGDPAWDGDHVALLSSAGYLYAFERRRQDGPFASK
ncbi:MAG: PQQ-binding-like beta-propeller repeat protein [Deltaproteobacteria bacterium]|nr:PQQ-binding-like beta-propeller repeat protein [Deltaproteobacteria bacterium]